MREKYRYSPDRIGQPRPKDWQEGIALTEQELEAIFLSDDFKTLLTQALRQTNSQPEKKAQEFGFVVSHLSDRRSNRQNGLAQTPSSFFVSDLFRGNENSINIYKQFNDYHLCRIYDYYKEPLPVLDFHTHPGGRVAFFSRNDLEAYDANSIRVNPHLISAMGINRSSHGSVLLISFNNSQAWRSFNPSAVYEKSSRYYGRSYSYSNDLAFYIQRDDVYKESGLNVAQLIIDRHTSTIEGVKEASRILTTRTG